MDVPSVTTGGIQPQKNNNLERAVPGRIRAVVNTITRAADRVLTGQSTASKLQAREAGFRQAAGNLARVSTLAQAADDGVRQIRGELARLRTADSDEAKKIRDTIDRVATTTTFEGRPLLNGSRERISLEETLSGTGGSKDDITLSLPDLSSRALVGTAPAPERIEQAVRTVDTVAADVDDFRRAVDVVAASIDTVAANHQAAQSELQPQDFERTPLKEIRENRDAAIGAQARLNPAVVKLVN